MNAKLIAGVLLVALVVFVAYRGFEDVRGWL